ncbi:DUF2274 domain-containing protein [Mesorhizobium sp. M0622]|uniref:DUF2274 domain-containing protein n=1 Tax=Mesorhizobium sp. M0622 TaxID=2956975 RepID=UPI0033388224
MTKLKLSAIPDDRPVKITVELPRRLTRSCRRIAQARDKTGQAVADPCHAPNRKNKRSRQHAGPVHEGGAGGSRYAVNTVN